MNRQPISLNLPYDPTIQPAAAPVDKFHAPIVNGPDFQQAHDLAALGDALSKLEPTVQSVFSQQFDAYTQTSKEQATRDRAEQRLDSMAKFRDAVNSGKIQQSQNPWYTAQMEEEIGRVSANRAVNQAWMEYEQTPDVRKSNDVNVVSKFFADRFGAAVKDESGGSVWAAGAMSKVFDQAQNELVQRHVAVRSRELPEEREVSAKAEIATILGSYTDQVQQDALAGKPEALAVKVAARDALQGKLNDLLHTVDAPTANKWVKEAVMDHAMSTENADIAKDLIGSLTTTDGKGLLVNDADRVQMKNLSDRVRDMRLHRLDQDERLEKDANKKLFESTASVILGGYADAKGKGQEFDWNQALSSDQIKNLPVEVQQSLVQTMMQRLAFDQQGSAVKDENARRDILKNGAANYLLGRMGSDGQVKFLDLLLQYGGHHDAATLIQTKRQLEDMKYPDNSDPGALGDLVKQIGDGTITGTNAVDRIIEATKSGKLSLRDSREFSMFMLSRIARSDQWQDRGEFQVSASRLGMLIRDKRRDDLGGTLTQERLDTVMNESVSKASKDFLFEYNKMTGDSSWAAIKDPQERMNKINALVDQIASSNGGYTESQGQQAAAKRLAQEQKDAAAEEARLKAKQTPEVHVLDQDINNTVQIGDPALKEVDNTVQQALRTSGVNPDAIAPSPNKKPWFGKLNYTTPELTDLVNLQQANMGERGRAATEATGEAGQKYAEAAFTKLEGFRQNALVAAQALGSTIQNDNYVARIKQTSTDIARQGFATERQKSILTYLWTRMREYALLRQRAGYSVEEVKALGKDAYLHVPMFATERDVIDNGPKVGKALGLTPQQAGVMMSEQQAILRNFFNP